MSASGNFTLIIKSGANNYVENKRAVRLVGVWGKACGPDPPIKGAAGPVMRASRPKYEVTP